MVMNSAPPQTQFCSLFRLKARHEEREAPREVEIHNPAELFGAFTRAVDDLAQPVAQRAVGVQNDLPHPRKRQVAEIGQRLFDAPTTLRDLLQQPAEAVRRYFLFCVSHCVA